MDPDPDPAVLLCSFSQLRSKHSRQAVYISPRPPRLLPLTLLASTAWCPCCTPTNGATCETGCTAGLSTATSWARCPWSWSPRSPNTWGCRTWSCCSEYVCCVIANPPTDHPRCPSNGASCCPRPWCSRWLFTTAAVWPCLLPSALARSPATPDGGSCSSEASPCLRSSTISRARPAATLRRSWTTRGEDAPGLTWATTAAAGG